MNISDKLSNEHSWIIRILLEILLSLYKVAFPPKMYSSDLIFTENIRRYANYDRRIAIEITILIH